MVTTCNQKNWDVTTDVNELNSYPLVKLGSRHQPIAHGEVVEMFNNQLSERKLDIVKSVGMLSKDHMKYVYVCDIVDNDDAEKHDDFVFTVGFVNYNNRQKAFTGLYGERVFVCSNEMYRGEDIEFRRKHTTGLIGTVLLEKIDYIINRFYDFKQTRLAEIERLKNCRFTDRMLGDTILAMTRQGVVGNTNILNVVREFDHPRHEEFRERNAWNFQQAFTEMLKNVEDPTRRIAATNKMKDIIIDVTGINR